MKLCKRMFRVPDPQNANTGFCQKTQWIFFFLRIGESVNIFQLIFWNLQNGYPFVLKWNVFRFRGAPHLSWWNPTKFRSKSIPITNNPQQWPCGCLCSGHLADCPSLNSGFVIFLLIKCQWAGCLTSLIHNALWNQGKPCIVPER